MIFKEMPLVTLTYIDFILSRSSILRVYYVFKVAQNAISFLIAKTRIVEHRSIDVDRTWTYTRIYTPIKIFICLNNLSKKKRRKTNHRTKKRSRPTNYPIKHHFSNNHLSKLLFKNHKSRSAWVERSKLRCRNSLITSIYISTPFL